MIQTFSHLRTAFLAVAGIAVAGTPAFEVASIRPSAASTGEGKRRESIEPGPSNLTMRNVSLQACIGWAYNVQQLQISGPAWLNADRFDIVAKAGSPATESQLRLMLQALLADRFKLVFHRQSKEMSAASLLIGKTEPKLKESEGDGPPNFNVRRMVLTAERVSMPQFAEILSDALRAPVIDMTGLKGRYDFKVDPSKHMPAETADKRSEASLMDDIAAAFRAAVQEQLGLRIESRKAPVEILVVDSAARAPSEN